MWSRLCFAELQRGAAARPTPPQPSHCRPFTLPCLPPCPLACLQVLDACLKEIATALLQADVNVRLVANLRCARGCLRRLPLRLRLQQCAMRAAPCHLAGSLLSACSCEVHLLVGIMHNSG